MARYVYYTDEYLAHHGIKGQKWGRRRFQNPDGSLTMEGYQHWGLNPDGSKFRGHRNKKGYTDATSKASRTGLAVGAAIGSALGAAAGPVGLASGASTGMLIGAVAGTAIGTINTRRMQHKIRKMLKEQGTVYVKDL